MKIVILSRSPEAYSTKRLVEAGKSRGHETLVVDHLKCVLVIEQGRPHIYYKDEEVKDVDAVIPRIGASVTFYGAAVVRQFEMMKIFSAVESQALVRSRDKLRCLQLLAKSGIAIPKSAFVSTPKHVENVINLVGGAPVVIKLLEGTQGIGVILAETKNSAKSVVEAFLDVEVDILVQEFVKEAGGQDVRAFVVDGQVVGAMKRTGIKGDFRSNLHRGGTAEVVKLNAQEKKLAIRAAKLLGLGVAGVDMLPTSKGLIVNEVNSSPGLEGIEKATGVNIAEKIIEYVERNEVPND
ncbi:MAG: 30S ribosomal protein S6--L-glutamate ligase [Bacteroidia bacterium]